jgi:hypothetical protein
MSVQTTYELYQDRGLPGQRRDISPYKVDNYVAETAIPFGRGVSLGTDDGKVALAAAGETLIGLALRASIPNDGVTTSDYPIGSVVPAGSLGSYYAEVVGAATKGADAFVITTVGANQGKLSASSDSGALGPIGKFAESKTDALVIVDVSLALQGATGPEGPGA